ncbi:putative membrane protein [Chitinophaga skermanii]|uniref:Putative membrane protein n=1 Tax=Chitinophaga skermanii TaxID=331697 RepID=A0A327QFS2_9BACT|nr:bestrophin family ion channel [Chitinophaga skermanii]RAJ02472.1 putative membrane protein [Chitinophaga skermanii]
MVNYNPKDWFTFIFRVHKADTVQKLWRLMVCLAVYAAVVAYFELEYWKLSGTKNGLSNISMMHGLLGFVISLLLVFRTNTAYDRWWEGRKLWGSLVNDSRNLALKIQAILPPGVAIRDYFRIMIPNYAYALKNHLRNNQSIEELQHTHNFDPATLKIDQHIPNQIAGHMLQEVQALYRQGLISGDQLITINQELSTFTNVCGACERIRNTPIPFSYSAFIKKFIFFYVMTLPFGYVFSVGYFIIPMSVFIFYVLASLELIAEEIEDPFGKDANDLPLDTMSANIRKHVAEIL